MIGSSHCGEQSNECRCRSECYLLLAFALFFGDCLPVTLRFLSVILSLASQMDDRPTGYNQPSCASVDSEVGPTGRLNRQGEL